MDRAITWLLLRTKLLQSFSKLPDGTDGDLVRVCLGDPRLFTANLEPGNRKR